MKDSEGVRREGTRGAIGKGGEERSPIERARRGARARKGLREEAAG